MSSHRQDSDGALRAFCQIRIEDFRELMSKFSDTAPEPGTELFDRWVQVVMGFPIEALRDFVRAPLND